MHRNQLILLGAVAQARRQLGMVEQSILDGDPPFVVWNKLFAINAPEYTTKLVAGATSWDDAL